MACTAFCTLAHPKVCTINAGKIMDYDFNKLSDRLKWLRHQRGITKREIAADEMGIPRGTYQRWEHKGTPTMKHFKEIKTHYGCSLGWLTSGEGDPFPGTKKEVSVPGKYAQDKDDPGINEVATQYSEPNQVEVLDDLTLAGKVLSSKTPYAVALHLNIRSFARAINAEERITQVETKLKILEIKFNDMVRDGLVKPGSTAGAEPEIKAGESQISEKQKAM